MHVGLLQWFLQFAHAAADHRAWPRAGGVNEIGNPDFACQLRGAKRLSVLIHQLKNCIATAINNPPSSSSIARYANVTIPTNAGKPPRIRSRMQKNTL